MTKKIFDQNKLMEWSEVDPENWRDLVNSILGAFFEVCNEQYRDLTELWEAGDLPGLRRSAHRFKSTCGNVGAALVHDILDRIENLEGDEGFEELMGELERTVPASFAKLREFKNTLQAA